MYEVLHFVIQVLKRKSYTFDVICRIIRVAFGLTKEIFCSLWDVLLREKKVVETDGVYSVPDNVKFSQKADLVNQARNVAPSTDGSSGPASDEEEDENEYIDLDIYDILYLIIKILSWKSRTFKMICKIVAAAFGLSKAIIRMLLDRLISEKKIIEEDGMFSVPKDSKYAQRAHLVRQGKKITPSTGPSGSGVSRKRYIPQTVDQESKRSCSSNVVFSLEVDEKLKEEMEKKPAFLLSEAAKILFTKMKYTNFCKYIIFNIENRFIDVEAVGAKDESYEEFYVKLVKIPVQGRLCIINMPKVFRVGEASGTEWKCEDRLVLIIWCPIKGNVKENIVYLNCCSFIKTVFSGLFKIIHVSELAGAAEDVIEHCLKN